MVRVRFAPSPTGNLHVGSARTALFNWFFARHEGGTFILRIEDTDLKRSNPAFLQDIVDSLAYLGIRADEGPVFQSQRQALYHAKAEQLLQEGKAIRQEGAIVFPVAPQQVRFTDLLHGEIVIDTSLFESLVLIKSDGSPAYNFACVVDDVDMRISHVIRGDDHIANTPKQVVLYQAFGASLPQFIHIPLIVGADRARLSKRQGATSVNEYRAVGYLPEAFVNYLALLGWSPGGNREMLEPQELVQAFELSRVRKTAAQFDQQKLDWLNSQHLKRMPLERLTELFAQRLAAKGLVRPDVDRAWLSRIAKLLQDRIKVLSDLEDEHGFFFTDAVVYQEESVAQFLRQDGIRDRLLALKARLGALPAFDTESVERATRALIAEGNLQTKDLIHPTRVALTGRAVSPPLFETMSILGRDTVLSRLEHAATQLVRENDAGAPRA